MINLEVHIHFKNWNKKEKIGMKFNTGVTITNTLMRPFKISEYTHTCTYTDTKTCIHTQFPYRYITFILIFLWDFSNMCFYKYYLLWLRSLSIIRACTYALGIDSTIESPLFWVLVLEGRQQISSALKMYQLSEEETELKIYKTLWSM